MGFIYTLFTSIGCGMFGFSCFAATSTAPLHGISVVETASSTPGTMVVTTDSNGKTKMQTIRAPYGVETSVVSTSKGGTTTSAASTTPLSSAQAAQMVAQSEAQIRAMQLQMQQMFAAQQKLFQQMQAGW